ncbi:hypothetical protein T11_17967 [Trichinella zimbabwensis]|uniref:Uncharacterized protein n=1 Tax=Trichinella zimbabwensis TaxID=268475 RepID=A0A0V1H0Q8_9BILA|nr:hypothetical protein T11_17967 [Trichinella zimbabwensis]
MEKYCQWPASASTCSIVTLSKLIRMVDITFSLIAKKNRFWLLSLPNGNNVSVVMHAAQQYYVADFFGKCDTRVIFLWYPNKLLFGSRCFVSIKTAGICHLFFLNMPLAFASKGLLPRGSS